MSVSMILSALKLGGLNSMSLQAWQEEQEMIAEKVRTYREYSEGDQVSYATAKQRRILNQAHSNHGNLHDFTDNYCAVILDTTLDRIKLTTVEGENDAASEWAEKLLKRNRFDALQVDVHEATLRDGNTFLMVSADPVTREVRFTHEPAYDGSYGTLVHYETSASKEPSWAVKIWRISDEKIADTARINVYYPNRIERWVGNKDGAVTAFTGDGLGAVLPWTMTGREGGEPIGVPFIHFRNRGSTSQNVGLSELENVVPLQDLLNRTLYDMAAASTLSAFGVRVMIGAQAPDEIEPGMILSIYPKDATGRAVANLSDTLVNWLGTIRLEQFEQGDLAPYIAQAQWIKAEMFSITNTPSDDTVSAQSSGEARKQSEVKLLGKVRRFEVRNGNAWEDSIALGARVATAFNAKEASPPSEFWNAKWDSPELRDDSQTQADAITLWKEGLIPQKAVLELLQPLYDWTPEQIDGFVADTETSKAQQHADGATGTPERMARVADILQRAGVGETVNTQEAVNV